MYEPFLESLGVNGVFCLMNYRWNYRVAEGDMGPKARIFQRFHFSTMDLLDWTMAAAGQLSYFRLILPPFTIFIPLHN